MSCTTLAQVKQLIATEPTCLQTRAYHGLSTDYSGYNISRLSTHKCWIRIPALEEVFIDTQVPRRLLPEFCDANRCGDHGLAEDYR